MDSGYSQDAIADFNKILQINPRHSMALYKRGKIIDTIGDSYGAINDYSASLKTIKHKPMCTITGVFLRSQGTSRAR